MASLLPPLDAPTDRPALGFPDRALTYAQLAAAIAELRSRLPSAGAVALWAAPHSATAIGVVAALTGGRDVVPIDPRCGEAELARILDQTRPRALLAPPEVSIAGLDTLSPGADRPARSAPVRDAGRLIVFTSGTTGPPKGVVLTTAAIAANLDALAAAWGWNSSDVLVHALPLYHLHGLALATLGTLRLGGEVRHIGAFDPAQIASALVGDATMLFAVPTMYHRLAEAAAGDPRVADGLRAARLLVSGSAALPAAEHARIRELSGQRIVERYGMTETLMIAAVRADGDRRAGYVGRPLPGVELSIRGEDGAELPADDASIGDVLVRGPSLFEGYLGAPQETAEAYRDGWFATGDLGTLAPDGYLRLVGRRNTDLIKSGGFRIGAAEIESALLDHPSVTEAAVLGLPDPDLGERIVAWVVARADVDAATLIDHVATRLTPHKRPREVRFVDALPRNALGKVQKLLIPQ